MGDASGASLGDSCFRVPGFVKTLQRAFSCFWLLVLHSAVRHAAQVLDARGSAMPPPGCSNMVVSHWRLKCSAFGLHMHMSAYAHTQCADSAHTPTHAYVFTYTFTDFLAKWGTCKFGLLDFQTERRNLYLHISQLCRPIVRLHACVFYHAHLGRCMYM